MHSSYQLNTVFTDVYLLLLQNYKLAQVATGLTSRYSYGTTLLWKPVLREARGGGVGEGLAAALDRLSRTAARRPKPLTGSTAERKPMGNKSVYN